MLIAFDKMNSVIKIKHQISRRKNIETRISTVHYTNVKWTLGRNYLKIYIREFYFREA